ncbi:MAG TPA: hypothetical protein VHX36_07130 [Candidatus Acidoferrales bacterium]|jgi:hypothetical protein|nr:hypothetical protein [Candidatus Acidoferrales bacterium]
MRLGSHSRIAARGVLASALIAFACLAGVAASAVSAQDATPQPARETQTDLKPFLGTWKASIDGRVFAILILKDDRGSLDGDLNNFDLAHDKEGNLTGDTHVDAGDGPILNVHLRSGVLYFTAIQKDQYSPSTDWKFVPKDAKEGELTQLLDGKPYAENGSVPKPIQMLRDHPKP